MTSTAANKQTVFIVDDDQGLRDAFKETIIEMDLNVECFANAQSFLDSYQLSQSGCLVLDLRLPGMSGLELQEKLNNNNVYLPIIVITGHGDVPTSVKAMKQGAVDFFEKPYHPSKLRESILRALELEANHRKERLRYEEFIENLKLLTQEERRVMDMMSEGKTNKEIARVLDVSLRTVHSRRESLFKKLNIENRAQLLQKAAEAKMAPLSNETSE